jgi:hypothetical protein
VTRVLKMAVRDRCRDHLLAPAKAGYDRFKMVGRWYGVSAGGCVNLRPGKANVGPEQDRMILNRYLEPTTGRGYKREISEVPTVYKISGAEEGTRTPTPLRVHGPEPCASANSATSACRDVQLGFAERAAVLTFTETARYCQTVLLSKTRWARRRSETGRGSRYMTANVIAEIRAVFPSSEALKLLR